MTYDAVWYSIAMCNVWYCIMLYGTVWYCGVLYGAIGYFMVMYGHVWHCMVLYGTVWYCMVLYGTAWHSTASAPINFLSKLIKWLRNLRQKLEFVLNIL